MRPVQQARGDVDAPLHPAGERLDAVLGPVRQADLLQHLVHTPAKIGAAQVIEAAPEGQVLPGGEVVIEGDLLRHDADAGANGQAVSCDGVAVDLSRAGAGCDQAAQHGDGSRLARAVGAQQAEDLAAQDGERDVVNGDQVAIPLTQMIGN
jgi:hypothetical protein